MNFPRFLLIALLLSSLSGATNAQVPPKTVLLNEIGDPQCEFLWAALDHLRAEILNKPGSFATVEISGVTGDPRGNFYWEAFIRNHLARYTPKASWAIHRTAVGSDRRVKLWLTPPGGDPPKINVAEWSFIYPPDTKPFVFSNGGEDHSVKSGVCLYVDEIRLLANALRENPEARLNVVLIVPSDRAYRRRRANTLRMLTREYSISPSHIRIFRKLDTKPDPHDLEPDAEYWFVP